MVTGFVQSPSFRKPRIPVETKNMRTTISSRVHQISAWDLSPNISPRIISDYRYRRVLRNHSLCNCWSMCNIYMYIHLFIKSINNRGRTRHSCNACKVFALVFALSSSLLSSLSSSLSSSHCCAGVVRNVFWFNLFKLLLGRAGNHSVFCS